MFIRKKIILLVCAILISVMLSISSVWYLDSSRLMDTYVQATAQALMKDAYNAFAYLLTETEYLSSLIIMNRENVITPLQVINAEAERGEPQLTHTQLINKWLIDSYIGAMYGHKYYITGISIVSIGGYLFKTGEALYYPASVMEMVRKYNLNDINTQITMLPPAGSAENARAKTGSYVIPAIRSIQSFEGETIGYVLIYFDYGIIRNMFSSNLPENSMFNVTDRWGNNIFSNSPDIIDGNKHYTESFYFAEKAGWTFSMAIPTTAIRANINITIWKTLLIMVIIAISAIAIGIIMVYRITSNLKTLNNAMLQVSSGNLEIKTNIKGKDEIGRMSHIFDDMISNVKKLMEQITLEENSKRKTEIDFLQAQISPHFISNTLNTIIWMAQLSNADNIVNLTRSLISLLHSSMKRGSHFISIDEEIIYIKNYVEIQKYCGTYDFSISYEMPDDSKSIYTLRFILQPLVENAIIHGIAGCEGDKEIRVSVKQESNAILMEVFDNGVGMSQEQLDSVLSKEHNGKGSYSRIGLKNIQERIRLFFGDAYGLSFRSKLNEFTLVCLRIPLLYSPEEYPMTGDNHAG